MVHIKAYFPTIRPSNNKKDSNENNHERNKDFQLPAFPTANQSLWHFVTANVTLRYGQNLAVKSTNVGEFVSGPILAVAVRENVWEPLKLGLISG